MGLIKQANTPSQVASFSMRDIEAHARAMIEKARQQAEQLLMEAQLEGENIRKAAHAEGLAAGHAEGEKSGRQQGHAAGLAQALEQHKAELTAAAQALAAAAAEVEAHRQELESQAGRDVVRLAVAVARKACKRWGEVDENVALANVSEALKLVISQSDVRIAIHPSQRQILEEALPRLRMMLPSLTHVEVVDDPALAPGGCRVFTRTGEIDADLDGQIDRIVLDLLPSAPGA